MLGITFQPYPDEMLHSWIERNAYANCYDNINDFLRDFSPLSRYKIIGSTSQLYMIFHLLNVEDWAKMYSEHTEYSFVAPFLNEYGQISVLNAAFGIDSFKPKSFIHETFVCPECQKEHPYFRVWHNLPGVTVCYRHKCPLVRADNYFEVPDFKEDCVPVSVENIAYAEYSHDLHKRNLSCNVSYINSLLGIGSSSRAMHTDIDVKKLMAKYPSVNDIPLPYQRDFIPAEDYELLHQCGNVIDLMHMPCHTRFCSTVSGFKYDFRCPSCAQKLSEAERFARHVYTMGSGKYKLVEPYTSRSEKIKMLHTDCGTVSTFTPISFLSGTRCKCENFRTIESLKILFKERYPGFTPISYEGSELTVRHDDCGNIFTVKWNHWAMNAFCRICHPRKYLDKETVQSEVKKYNLELVDFFKQCDKTKVTVKCPAGHISTIGLYHLHDIQGCPQCLALNNPKPATESLYGFIKATYSNSLFFYDDMLGLFGTRAKRVLQFLRDKQLIIQVARGCYRLPEVTVSSTEVINQKYIIRNGEHIGYLYGTSFLYYCLGIGEEPDRLSIATVKEAKPWARLTSYNNTELRLKAAPESMDEDNWQILQVADFINGIPFYCKSPSEVIPKLLKYIDDKALSKSDIIKQLTGNHCLMDSIRMELEDEKEK